MTRPVRRAAAAALLASGLTLGVGALTTVPALAAPPAGVNVVGLSKGASGPAVVALQNALNHAGIGVKYGVDGYFGSATQASVKAFQTYKHLPATGVVDTATARALGLAAPAAQPAAQPAAAPARPAAAAAAAPAVAPATNVVGLGKGAGGPAVVSLQNALNHAGIGVKYGVDGYFGSATQASVKAFQNYKHLPVTGVVDTATARALGLVAPAAQPAAAPARPAAATAARPAATPAAAPAPAAPAAAAPAAAAPSVLAAASSIPAVSPRAAVAVTAALSQQGVPYRFAAASPGVAFDCSGLTAWAWAQAGVSLPHQSLLQYLALPHVPNEAAQPGDLLFFHTPISHVTVYVGNGMMVQAPSSQSVVQMAKVNWGNVVAVGRPG
jgi:cell wall-associated NlpC family hydrolase